MKRMIGFATIVVGMSLLVASRAPAQAYGVEELRTLGGQDSVVLAMNELGQVVGWAQTERIQRAARRSEQHAVLWQDGEVIDLDSLSDGWSEARDINDLGWIVGGMRLGEGVTHAFLSINGRMHDLNDLLLKPQPRLGPAIRYLFEATSIGPESQILACGFVQGDPRIHGFLLVPVAPVIPGPVSAGDVPAPIFDSFGLGHLRGAGECVPADVNSFDQVVGTSGNRAFRWSAGTIVPLEPLSFFSRAYAVTESGIVAGSLSLFPANEGEWPLAYLWDELGMRIELAALPGTIGWASEALDINENGLIVGWSGDRFLDVDPVAVLWKQGAAIDLNTLMTVPSATGVVLHLMEARSVNDVGQIAGTARRYDGVLRGYKLQPK